ncbi:hypothetical protein MY11210_005549 [Beauveria gryllotalpidicola]
MASCFAFASLDACFLGRPLKSADADAAEGNADADAKRAEDAAAKNHAGALELLTAAAAAAAEKKAADESVRPFLGRRKISDLMRMAT